MATARVKRDQNFWWLRLQYALKEGRVKDAEQARQKLEKLGFRVELTGGAK